MASGRQGAVRDRPSKRGPLDGRHADLIESRCEWRNAVATDPTQGAGVVTAIVAPRQLLVVAGGLAARLQADGEGLQKAAGGLRQGEFRPRRRYDLNGQRQSEDENAQPAATHSETLPLHGPAKERKFSAFSIAQNRTPPQANLGFPSLS